MYCLRLVRVTEWRNKVTYHRRKPLTARYSPVVVCKLQRYTIGKILAPLFSRQFSKRQPVGKFIDIATGARRCRQLQVEYVIRPGLVNLFTGNIHCQVLPGNLHHYRKRRNGNGIAISVGIHLLSYKCAAFSNKCIKSEISGLRIQYLKLRGVAKFLVISAAGKKFRNIGFGQFGECGQTYAKAGHK